MELLLVLALPFAGGLVLAFWGHRARAAELNSAMSLLTLGAAVALTARVIEEGSQFVWEENFFVDPFNVFLVALTAFVAFTTSLFSRPYMRIEADSGRLSPQRLRLYHSMFQMFTFTMLLQHLRFGFASALSVMVFALSFLFALFIIRFFGGDAFVERRA